MKEFYFNASFIHFNADPNETSHSMVTLTEGLEGNPFFCRLCFLKQLNLANSGLAAKLAISPCKSFES